MDEKKILSWNKRAALAYAIGVWTMFGSLVFFKYTGKLEQQKKDPASIPKKEKNPNEVVYETAYAKTVTVYREDYVIRKTLVLDFIKSFSWRNTSGDKDNSK